MTWVIERAGTAAHHVHNFNGSRRMHGEYKEPGGKLVVVDLTVEEGRLRRVQVSGDFFLEPDSSLDAINRALEGLPADSSEDQLATAVAEGLDPAAHLYGISARGVAVAVRRALAVEGTEDRA
ncbi:biotin--protein ligase [Novilysobacter spongiicola]|nr:biotin--protein ligase [Lysobacter spongiicola]